MFVTLANTDMYLAPFDLSTITLHVVAIGLYQAG